MSLITHRCTGCGHSDIGRLCRPGSLRERCGDEHCVCVCTPGPPEVIPTWDQRGQRIEAVLAPGLAFAAGAPTCRCQDCKALHERLTAA
jgi:hypothetical protein